METKVVINPHYGGFLLSELAVERMAELGSEWAKGELDQTNPYGLHGGDTLLRHDPILVRVVEELGYRAVDGHDDPTGCLDEDGNDLMHKDVRDQFEIVVVKGPRYQIREYDGLEWVETPETLDWIHIEEAS